MGIMTFQITPNTVTTKSNSMQFVLKNEKRNIQRNCIGKNNLYPMSILGRKSNCVVKAMMDFMHLLVEKGQVEETMDPVKRGIIDSHQCDEVPSESETV